MNSKLEKLVNSYKYKSIGQRAGLHIIIVYAALCEFVTVIRCFKSVFWADEAFTFWISNMNIPDIIHTTSEDVHPPLYYFIVHYLVNIFGKSPFVYHIISVIAYTAMLILATTIIRKLFDTSGAILFITFLTILGNTTIQNIEVRMYSWAMLFVTIAFINLLFILGRNEVKYFAIYTIAILAASYTHYYAFLSVLIMTSALFIYALFRKKYRLRVVISCLLASIIYSPWLIILYRTFRQKKDDYWIKDIPSFVDCMSYIYKSEKALELLLLIITALIFVYVVFIKKTTEKYLIWIIIGLLSVLGTTLAGIAVSYIFRPLFQVKYMYPCISIIWLILIYCIKELQHGRIINFALTIVLLIMCGRLYYDRILSENEFQIEQDSTMSQIEGIISDKTLIVFDDESIDWRLVEYYFPHNPSRKTDKNDLTQLVNTDALNNYIVITDENALECDMCIQGRIGTDKLNIYIYSN